MLHKFFKNAYIHVCFMLNLKGQVAAFFKYVEGIPLCFSANFLTSSTEFLPYRNQSSGLEKKSADLLTVECTLYVKCCLLTGLHEFVSIHFIREIFNSTCNKIFFSNLTNTSLRC